RAHLPTSSRRSTPTCKRSSAIPNSRRSISNASRCSRYPVRSKPLPNIYARIRLNGARSSIRRTLRSNECSRASRFGLSGIDLGKHHEQRSFALLALEKRIAIIPDNTRQLVEQAAAFSGAFALKNSTRLFSPGLKLRHPPASGRIAVGCTSTKPSRPVANGDEKGADLNIDHFTPGGTVRLMPDKHPAGITIMREQPPIPIGTVVNLSSPDTGRDVHHLLHGGSTSRR